MSEIPLYVAGRRICEVEQQIEDSRIGFSFVANIKLLLIQKQ